VLAAFAVLAVIAAVVSDTTNESFWEHHALLTSLAASVIVVALSVAVVNEVLERRSRQRWSILAQYVMFELVRNARMVWTGILESTGLLPSDLGEESVVEVGGAMIRDTPRLAASLRTILHDVERRERLQEEVAFLAEHTDEVLGRWAAIMLNADAYAEVIDRHVELAGDISWIAGLMDTARPPADLRRQQRVRSSPAVQIEAEPGRDWLADRLVVVAQLAEELDRGTLELSLRIVPVEWWRKRLGTGDLPTAE
jgi:hypothetical protein